ncbi:hypothetical protein Tco_0032090 [Tanacetum coccineum]
MTYSELRLMFEKQAGVRSLTYSIFHACKQEEGKPVTEYVLKMKRYLEQLERLGYILIPTWNSVGLILYGPILKSLWDLGLGMTRKAETRSSLPVRGQGCSVCTVEALETRWAVQKSYGCLNSFDKCESCLSGKMTKKHFPHSNERAKDLLGIIHTDVCGPLRHVSRQGSCEDRYPGQTRSKDLYAECLRSVSKQETVGGTVILKKIKKKKIQQTFENTSNILKEVEVEEHRSMGILMNPLAKSRNVEFRINKWIDANEWREIQIHDGQYGFVDPNHPEKEASFKRSIYGLKQAIKKLE